MRIWAFAVHRWQFTSVVFLLLVALGAFALSAIPTQEDPTFPIPLTTIVVVYPGADPEDVERLATDPIEDAIAEIEDVKQIRSTSESGLAVIRVEFEWTVDADDKYDEVVREVNALRGALPADIRSIDFDKANPGLVNIAQYAITGDHLSPRALQRLAEDLENSLETVPGVRRAESWGYPQPEIRVALNLPRMAALGLDASTVNEAVQGEGESVPGGAVQIGERRYNLKGTGDYASIEAVADTVVAERDGHTVLLRDIAEVAWSTEEPAYLARFNGQRAAFVTANMKDGYSIFDVQRALDARVATFSASLPTGVKVETGFVQADNVRLRLNRLGIDFLIAIALVALTLLPLGWRAGGIVMIAIPLSLAMGIAGLWALGFSLNQISIAGFVVALGLLVDDAIVVVENISRFLREGHDRKTAAILATDQIALAVLGCTATLILAFLPLLNLPEGPGKFTRGLPLAVVLTGAGLPVGGFHHRAISGQPPAAATRARRRHAPAALAEARHPSVLCAGRTSGAGQAAPQSDAGRRAGAGVAGTGAAAGLLAVSRGGQTAVPDLCFRTGRRIAAGDRSGSALRRQNPVGNRRRARADGQSGARQSADLLQRLSL